MAAWTESTPNNKWVENMEEVSRRTEDAIRITRLFDEWLWENVVGHDVLPRKMPEPLASMMEQLQSNLITVEEKSRKIFQNFSSEPIAKYINGQRLNREEYYILAATGFPLITPKSMGQTELDEYEFFDMFYYEDVHRLGFINPEPDDRGQGVRLRIGSYPEELSIEGLRPEQHKFFRRFFPEIYARFKEEE